MRYYYYYFYLTMSSLSNVMFDFGFVTTPFLGGEVQISTMFPPTIALAKSPLSPMNDTRR